MACCSSTSLILMKNNSLVPTTISDKNGKITTVHKKLQKAAVSASLPSPSLPVTDSIDTLQLAVMERIVELYDKNHQSGFDYRPYLMTDIKKYSENMLHSLKLTLKDDTDLSESVAEQVVNGTGESTLNETIHYYKKSGSDDYLRTAAEVQALGEYSVVSSHEDLSLVDEPTQKQCLALMKFPRLVDTLPKSPSPFLDYTDSGAYDLRIIRSESLVNLIAQRPDDVEKIAEIALEYGTSNGAAINGIMDGAFPTTAEGYL